MEIYLVRHTKPLIEKDVCYGQTDVPVNETLFNDSAKEILLQLPEKLDALYSSPLIRCSYLATHIIEHKYPYITIEYNGLLKEIHFGDWENKKWDDINQVDLQKWMADFVNEPIPGGESFVQLHLRTSQFFELLGKHNYTSVIIVTHAGVIRSIISHIEGTFLKDAFTITCDYGSITKIKL